MTKEINRIFKNRFFNNMGKKILKIKNIGRKYYLIKKYR